MAASKSALLRGIRSLAEAASLPQTRTLLERARNGILGADHASQALPFLEVRRADPCTDSAPMHVSQAESLRRYQPQILKHEFSERCSFLRGQFKGNLMDIQCLPVTSVFNYFILFYFILFYFIQSNKLQ